MRQDTCNTSVPFVKWAGGKRSIVDKLAEYLPSEFNDYYEPFVGGGALFYHLHERINKAYLSDINSDLIITYNVIKNDVEKLIELLNLHQKNHNEEYYYQIRNTQQELKDPIAISARFLYLNKTCYNGLYRVNKKGYFNVPIGSYRNPDIVNKKNLRLCSKAFKIADINLHQFDKINPKSGDFVYFDPPYHPIKNNFTSYTKLDFSEQDQIRLRDFALELHKKGVMVMISNSAAEVIKKIYSEYPFTIRSISAPRYINCKPDERKNVEELIITTYE